MAQSPELRQLGTSGIYVTPVAMGCWPIAGMTSVEVNETDSRATLAAALDAGINFFDTAYAYGLNGESERMVGDAIRPVREDVIVATKGGIHWDGKQARQLDARPETLLRQCDESLQRLQLDHVDLYYLHAPDPQTPVAESAGALRRLLDAGKIRSVGASNCTVEQLDTFSAECPLAAVQPPYNMLQRRIEDDLLPWCAEHQVAAVVYWPLMKGLLAGKLQRNHQFAPQDGRAKYPMFQGRQWERNQDFVDSLRQMAADSQREVAEIVVNWTIHQPGITAALCGAKRPYQIRQAAAAMTWEMTDQERHQIDVALRRRGTAETRSAL